MYKRNHKRGYTLLFSIIVASIVLSIAAFILSISRKQFILSSAARDSTVAVYAADSGIQCAVEAYNMGLLATSTNPTSIYCYHGDHTTLAGGSSYDNNAGNISEDTSLVSGAGDDGVIYKTSRLQKDAKGNPIVIPLPNNTCAIIDVIQGYYKNGSTYSHRTIIDSRGYNIANSGPCDPGNNPVNPRAVERAIRLQYND